MHSTLAIAAVVASRRRLRGAWSLSALLIVIAVVAAGSPAFAAPSPSLPPSPTPADEPTPTAALVANLWTLMSAASDGTVFVNGSVDYIIRAHNDGPDAAAAVRLVITPPDGSGDGTLLDAPGWTCATAGDDFQCDLIAPSLTSGAETPNITLTATAPANVPATMTTRAVVSTTTLESNYTDNSAAITITVIDHSTPTPTPSAPPTSAPTGTPMPSPADTPTPTPTGMPTPTPTGMPTPTTAYTPTPAPAHSPTPIPPDTAAIEFGAGSSGSGHAPLIVVLLIGAASASVVFASSKRRRRTFASPRPMPGAPWPTGTRR